MTEGNNRKDYVERDEFSFGNRLEGEVGMEGGGQGGGGKAGGGGAGKVAGKAMPPTSVMTRLILIMVWRKLIRNPNTYSSLIGLTWALVSFKYYYYRYLPPFIPSNTLKPFFVFSASSMISIPISSSYSLLTLGRWNIMMPAIVAKSISILSDAGLGMAMFSLGNSLLRHKLHTYTCLVRRYIHGNGTSKRGKGGKGDSLYGVEMLVGLGIGLWG